MALRSEIPRRVRKREARARAGEGVEREAGAEGFSNVLISNWHGKPKKRGKKIAEENWGIQLSIIAGRNR